MQLRKHTDTNCCSHYMPGLSLSASWSPCGWLLMTAALVAAVGLLGGMADAGVRIVQSD